MSFLANFFIFNFVESFLRYALWKKTIAFDRVFASEDRNKSENNLYETMQKSVP